MANYKKRRWVVPHKRAKNYAQERKQKLHLTNPKKRDQPLTDFEAGIRAGYLQCQHDHAGIYNYIKAKKAKGSAPKRKAKKN